MTPEKQSKELVNVSLTPKDGEAKPGVLEAMLHDLKEMLPGLLGGATDAARVWFRGKAKQESAKAAEIFSSTVDRLARLAIDEKEQAHRHRMEAERHDLEMKQLEAELYLDSMKKATDIIKDLNEAGVDVNIEVFFHKLSSSLPHGFLREKSS